MVKGLEINKAKCTGCGTCADICPVQNIKLENRVPQPTSQEYCLNCGQCVSVCPTSALSIESMKPEDCQKFSWEDMPSIKQSDTLLKSRRSIRNYLDKLVPRETIKEILEVAKYSPSGLNAQPVKWLIVYDKSDVKRYASMTIDWLMSIKDDPTWLNRLPVNTYLSVWETGFDIITFNAPHFVMAYAEPRWEEECKMALTFFDLTAHVRGLGACWMGVLNLAANLWEPMKTDLALPVGTKPLGAMIFGYPKYRYSLIPARKGVNVEWR